LLGARLLAFERSAHFPYVEETERFAEEVTAFITRQRPDSVRRAAATH